MVSVERFRRDAEYIIDEIEQRCNDLEKTADLFFIVARNVQRVFRGYITRQHMTKLRESAVCIQKNWRGFSDRKVYEEMLKKRFNELCEGYYTAMATRIKRHWKGYWVRSRIFSFYKLKSWLEFVQAQNKHLKMSTERYQSIRNKHEIEQREEEAKQWIVYILFKLHHLLRTQQISGIYSLPNTRNLSDIEKMLTCLKYKDFMTFYNSYQADLREMKAKEIPTYILQNCKYPARFEREWREHKSQNREEYRDRSIPVDLYTRYELPEPKTVDENNQIQTNLGSCECSFCTGNMK